MTKAILLVEDEPWLAEAYQSTLSQAGYRLTSVATAADAMQAIDDFQPVLVILDMMLPRVNGLQLLHELQSHVDLRALPIIICSNTIRSSDLTKLANYGVKKILDKPHLTPGKLLAAVREVLLV